MQKRKKSKHYHITSFQIIILGFLSVILIGSLMLMLPIAARSGKGASFSDALFTATSAVCVTGLVTVSYTHLDVYKRQEKSTSLALGNQCLR